VREKECNYANISREECNNFIHVLRYVGAVDNKTRFVGGPFLLKAAMLLFLELLFFLFFSQIDDTWQKPI
jgi:hypothetical protein